MTAEEPTPTEGQESTDHHQHHVFDRESAWGSLMATVFVEPEKAAVEVKPVGDSTIQVIVRHATNNRGPTVQWMFPLDEAREFADELGETIDEIEAAD